jgi:uncharacterized tellurite resistance protein B-like protein
MNIPQTTSPLLQPGFTISADEAISIAGALQDIAECDGFHETEQEMIAELMEAFSLEMGEDKTKSPPKVTPAELAKVLVVPETRLMAIQVAVMLAMADGSISEIERQRILDYAQELGFKNKYAEIEKEIVEWIHSGDMSPLFA